MMLPLRGASSGSAWRARRTSEYTLTSCAMMKPAREVSTKRPSRSSRFAYATEWMSTSALSQCARICSKHDSTCASSVTSQGRINSALTLSARGRTRFSSASPAYVKMKLAPCSCIACAMPHAMLRSFATPNTRTRLPSNRRIGVMLRLSFPVSSFEDVERARHVLLREHAERYECCRALQTFDAREMLRDDIRDALPFRHTDDGNEIPVAGYRIHFRNSLDVRDCARCRRDVFALCADQHHSRNHLASSLSTVLGIDRAKVRSRAMPPQALPPLRQRPVHGIFRAPL